MYNGIFSLILLLVVLKFLPESTKYQTVQKKISRLENLKQKSGDNLPEDVNLADSGLIIQRVNLLETDEKLVDGIPGHSSSLQKLSPVINLESVEKNLMNSTENTTDDSEASLRVEGVF